MTDLTLDYVDRYLALKHAGKLGVIWADVGRPVLSDAGRNACTRSGVVYITRDVHGYG
jgi:hypothetical protein